ncbi:MAG: SNF2-related protein [Methylococcaceae bacterium]
MAKELGFSGGKVLDPCSGVGIFGATAPLNAVVDAVELNATSGRINGLINNAPGYKATVSPFERVAAATPDETYDCVISNVPFGEVADRGGNQLLDKRYRKEPIQNYFILRSLEKLKPGGLAIFITPPRCVSGKEAPEKKLRVRASYMAEFMGAYRLPNEVFGAADADTITDVIVFRKHGEAALEKIKELRSENPDVLVQANVQWQEFIDGAYFLGDGKRYVLGDFVPKNPEDFRPVDRVITKHPVGEIGKMLRKFEAGSRINWSLLDTTETQPILYQNGDTIAQAGETLQYQDGQWIPIEKSDSDNAALALLGKLKDPYSAFENKIDWKEAATLVRHLDDTAQSLNTPGWLRQTAATVMALDDGDQEKYWKAGVTALAAQQIMSERLGEDPSANLLNEFSDLSNAIVKAWPTAKKKTGAITGELKDALGRLTTIYDKKSGFSAVWMGNVRQESAKQQNPETADEQFERYRYQTRSRWVSIDRAKAIYGESFDPFESSDWCIDADGISCTKVGDFYTGSYGELMRLLDQQIADAHDDTVKAKLLRQKLEAAQFVNVPDPKEFTYNMFSPYVTPDELAEFMRRFVHPSAAVIFDEKTGKRVVDIDVKGSNLSDEDKLTNRIGHYLQHGSITLGGVKLNMGKKQAIKFLRDKINRANEQFDTYVKANPAIMARLQQAASNPDTLRFRPTKDHTALPIPGLNPDLKLHAYQNAFVRQMGRGFEGINGFNVGLGKTFTSLASVQYVQALGIKKKTLFVVPNSVVSNWRKEAEKAYSNTDDCLYIGLRSGKNGKPIVSSQYYDADLLSVLENRHSKIFLSYEAFERIRLKSETIERYITYLGFTDFSFSASNDKAKDERANSSKASLADRLSAKTGSAPFLEDMGIDSIVIDEAHNFKNSAEVSEFKGAKYLSLSPASNRGMDAQAKCWYIRRISPTNDGVLLLTATPITNSPLEIYSMLSLSVGRDRVNESCLDIHGSDHFMGSFCQKENEEDVTIDGIERSIDVFQGLQNVSLLRKVITENATIEDVSTVGGQIIMPDEDSQQSSIALPGEVLARLQEYKEAYRFAADTLKKNSVTRGSQSAMLSVMEHFGEPMELIAHPFNLLNKMALLIADPELDGRGSFYTIQPDQADLARRVIDQFNAKKVTEKRSRPGPLTQPGGIKEKKEITSVGADGEDIVRYEYKIYVEASLSGERIAVDTMDSDSQTVFENMAEKAGLNLDVSVPPKLAALVENFTEEEANPRGVDADGKLSSKVKQIVFCDILPLHNKIRRILSRRCGVSPAEIAIITGRTNNEPDEIMDVQEGFNSGEKYRTIIANEKAEVGINLQIGTQSIHHLTIGWTPDSLVQRNGRGVRQGNKTPKVSIYYYDADGTFDESKRALVSKKGEWISGLLNGSNGNSIKIEGGLSNKELDALISSIGDADGMQKVRDAVALQEAERRASGIIDKQNINLDTIKKQTEFLSRFDEVRSYAVDKLVRFWRMGEQIDKLKPRVSKAPKAQAAIDDLTAKRQAIAEQLIEAGISMTQYATATLYGKKINLNDADAVARVKYRLGDIKADSALYREWQSECDFSRSMTDEAIANFKLRQNEPGAMPASVVDAVAKGKYIETEAGILFPGVFLRSDGMLFVVGGSDNAIFTWLHRYFDERKRWGAIASHQLDSLGSAQVIYPGAAGYDAAIDQAAEIEDRLMDEGVDSTKAETYSTFVPEVAARMRNEKIVSFAFPSIKLPAPYFPYPVPPSDTASPCLKAIAQEQASIIKKWVNTQCYLSSSVVVEEGNFRGAISQAAYREYAIAHGLQVRPEEVEAILADEIGKIAETVQAGIKGDTLQERWESVRRGLAEQLPWCQLDTVPDQIRSKMRDTVYANESEAAKRLYQIAKGVSVADDKAQIIDAVLRAAPEGWARFFPGDRQPWKIADADKLRNMADEIAEKTGVSVQTITHILTKVGTYADEVFDVYRPGGKLSPPSDPNASVYIGGNTYPHKEDIKKHAAKTGASITFDGNVKQWRTQMKTWSSLIKDNPQLDGVLFVQPV